MFRNTLFLLILLPGILLAQNDNIKKELHEADLAIDKKEYSKALELVAEALAKSPYNLEALEKKVSIYLLQDQSKEILQEIEELIKQNPSQPEYYYIRGILQLHKEKFQKAIEDFDATIDLGLPSNILYKVYLNKGVAYFQYKEFEFADENFQKAADLNPQFAPIYHSWGMLKYETKEYETAVEYFTKSIQLEDKNPITYYNLGMAYFRLDEKEKACYYFNRSCALGHRNACRLQLMECADEINVP